jgi:ABC-type antimicrobial peptide transport system permease subunit
LSGFNPVTILKGKIKNSLGELLARKGLVVFQFVVSLVLIVAMLVIYRQVEFIQNRNLGYNKENVIYFDKTGKILENTESFLAELKKVPGVVNASAIQQNVIQGSVGNASTYGIDWPGKEPEQSVNFTVRSVDYDLLETLGIQLKEGRAFSRAFGTDNKGLIFNETAIRTMGLKNPLGTKVKMWDQEMEIIGVVKDFHISSLHESIAPMVFRLDPSRTAMVMAKLQAGRERESIAAIESFYKRFNPGYPFDYKFLDASFQAQYISEKRISALSTWFAALAILISCLGLFGLASFNAEVRTKEIGIRKVLGASERSIIFLLSGQFFKLLLAAIAIAFPIAWWAMNKWLSGYAYKTTIGIDVFLLAFLGGAVFTLITIGFQSVKAAIMNPVKNLRTE